MTSPDLSLDAKIEALTAEFAPSDLGVQLFGGQAAYMERLEKAGLIIDRTRQIVSQHYAEEVSTALADRDRYKDALDAAHKVFGAEITQMQQMVADTRSDAIAAALELAVAGGKDGHTDCGHGEGYWDGRCDARAAIQTLLTQPDRSAARQKVIETGAALCAAVGNPDPTGDVDPWYQQLWQFVQELQSPNKEEGGK